jgi:formylmethanofuran dehydrogenase subunit E
MDSQNDDAYIWVACADCGKSVGMSESALDDDDFVCDECAEWIDEDEEC